MPPLTPSSPLPLPAVERPRREAKPNPKYSPEMNYLSKVFQIEKIDEFGLGGLVENSPMLSGQQVIDMLTSSSLPDCKNIVI